MTARRSRRRQGDAVVLGAAAAVGAVVALAADRALGAVGLAFVAGVIGWALGRRQRPANSLPASKPARAAAGELAALAAERDRLAADVGRLTAELSEARASATAAWDAAASRPPSPPRADTAPLAARLLTDPLSGVRRLGPG